MGERKSLPFQCSTAKCFSPLYQHQELPHRLGHPMRSSLTGSFPFRNSTSDMSFCQYECHSITCGEDCVLSAHHYCAHMDKTVIIRLLLLLLLLPPQWVLVIHGSSVPLGYKNPRMIKSAYGLPSSSQHPFSSKLLSPPPPLISVSWRKPKVMLLCPYRAF